MAIVKGKKTEEIISYREAQQEERKILTTGRGKDVRERTIKKGEVYLENDKKERKATGSYYTPDYIVKYIVEHAVGPVLVEKFERLRSHLREAQQERRKFIKNQESLNKIGLGKAPEQEFLIGKNVLEDLFKIKVLDPAMGSGHFLVEAVDFITDKMLDFLNAFPWNPVIAYIDKTRKTILEEMEDQGISIDKNRLTDVNLLKRHILKRCIYGVDLNPMAVELAKVSLWLDCFTLGAPLSFLDHHLRCGNSLIGVTVEEVQKVLESGQTHLFASRFVGLMMATDLMRHVGELSDVTSAQVKESREEYQKASNSLAPFKRILDMYTSQWFGNGIVIQKKKKGVLPEAKAISFLKSQEGSQFFNANINLNEIIKKLPKDFRETAETAIKASLKNKFFHWELEFPEVFFGPRFGTQKIIERMENAGFDTVIGNPPWGANLNGINDFLINIYNLAKGQFDSYELFFEQAENLLSKNCFVGMIIPDSILKPEHQKLRNFLGSNKIKFVHRIGEGIFEDVYRASLVVIASNSKTEKFDSYQTVNLNKTHRTLLTNTGITLSDIVSKYGGNRIISDGWSSNGFSLLLGIKSGEEEIINKMESRAINWNNICEDFRGIEFSQKGIIIICSGCGLANTPPKQHKGIYKEKKCENCGTALMFSPKFIRNIVSLSLKDFKKPRKFIRGEDVNRYNIRTQLYVDTDVNGINFKDENIYQPPKILVRKTGFGIYACIDNSDAVVPQSVYIFKKKEILNPYSLEYVIGVLNSRLSLYYYVKKTGESEWKSFPYITQKTIKEIPLPLIDFTDQNSRKLHSEIIDMVREMHKKPNLETDMKIERKIWEMYGLSFEKTYDELKKYLTSKVQSLRIIREMFPNDSF